MKTKLVLASGSALVIATLVVILVVVGRNSEELPTHAAQAKAMRNGGSPACSADNTKLFKLSDSAKQSIDMAVVGQLIDVPAGTSVDVQLATYSQSNTQTKITGSEKYGSGYGSYNFSATKETPRGDWRITAFTACG